MCKLIASTVGTMLFLLGLVGGTAQAFQLYSTSVPSFSGSFDLESGAVQQDSTVLIVVFGEEDEVEQVFAPSASQLYDVKQAADTIFGMTTDSIGNDSLFVLSEEFVKVARVDKAFDFANIGELEFEQVNQFAPIAMDASELLLFQLPTMILSMNYSANQHFGGIFTVDRFDVVPGTTVPEPTTVALMTIGVIFLAAMLKKKGRV